MSSRPTLNVEQSGDTTAIRFVDCKVLNDQAVEAIREELFALADKIGKGKLQLHFGAVEFVCSGFLGALITVQRKLTESGGQLSIADASSEIVKIFELTGLTKLLNIERKKVTG